MNELLSIVVPVYNVQEALARCMTSIFRQSYPALEILAVDDGSTDGSGALLDALALQEPRLRVLHQPNAGVTAARLAGIAMARGKWIGFVDGDDEIEPDMYRLLLENAHAWQADISHCGYQMCFADGRIHCFHGSGVLRIQDTRIGLQDLLEGTLVEPGLWNKLYRRELFDGLAVDTNIRINEDLLMNYLLFARADRSVFQDVCLYHYRVRGGSASRAPLNLHRIWDPIRVKEQILQQEIPGMEESARRAYLSTCIHIFNSLMLDKTRAFGTEESKIRNLLQGSKGWLGLLSKKQRLLAQLLLTVPGLYRYLYRFYARFILKNPYQ